MEEVMDEEIKQIIMWTIVLIAYVSMLLLLGIL